MIQYVHLSVILIVLNSMQYHLINTDDLGRFR